MTHEYRERIYSHYVETHISSTDMSVRLKRRGPYLRRIIRKYFPDDREAPIMDLGCGYGALLHFAHEAGYMNMVGIDVSVEQVAEAKKMGITGVSQGDLMNTLRELSDESQELVICFDVIEHFSKAELILFVDEVYRVLKKNGKWLIHQPNAASPFFGRVLYGDYSHEQAFTSTSLSQLLRASRFREICCFEDTPIIHGANSMLRWLIWKMIRASLLIYLLAETGEANEILTQNFLGLAKK